MKLARSATVVVSLACFGCGTASLPSALPEEPVTFVAPSDERPGPPPAMIETPPAPLQYTPLKNARRSGQGKRPGREARHEVVAPSQTPQGSPGLAPLGPRLMPVSLPAQGLAPMRPFPMPQGPTPEDELPLPLAQGRKAPRDPTAQSALVPLVQPVRVVANGLVRYQWAKERQFLVTAAPDHPVILYLPEGEKLKVPPAADPTKFEFGFVKQGEGEQEIALIVVRPTAPGHDITTAIISSARTYYVRLKSVEDSSMLGVQWIIPGQDEEARSAAGSAKELPELPELPGMPAFDVRRLHVGYDIKATKGTPPWIPTAVFDDGTRTVIRFGRSLGFTDAPAVFALQANQTPALVEWTPWEVPNQPEQPSYYTVGNIWPRLLLKSADADVTITRHAVQRRPYQPLAQR